MAQKYGTQAHTNTHKNMMLSDAISLTFFSKNNEHEQHFTSWLYIYTTD